MRFIFLLLVPLLLCLPVYAIDGVIIKVKDGDTIEILTPEDRRVNVRLFGIDAPEKKQPYSSASKEHLMDLCPGGHVRVTVMGADRYARIIGILYCGNINVNLEQVSCGYAWVYDYYMQTETQELQDIYYHAQSAAIADKKGLWQEDTPTPPWEFRSSKNKSMSGRIDNQI